MGISLFGSYGKLNGIKLQSRIVIPVKPFLFLPMTTFNPDNTIPNYGSLDTTISKVNAISIQDNSYYFNGGYITLPQHDILNPNSATNNGLTFSVFLYPYAEYFSSYLPGLLSLRENNNAASYQVLINSTGNLIFSRLYQSAWTDTTTTIQLSNRQWQHITIILDKSLEKIRIIKNADFSSQYVLNAKLTDYENTTLKIGFQSWTGRTYYGLMKNFIAYSRIISDQEITNLYNYH